MNNSTWIRVPGVIITDCDFNVISVILWFVILMVWCDFVISVIYDFKVHFWGEVKHFFIMLVLIKQVWYSWSPPVSEHFRWCTERFSKYFRFPLTPCVKQKVFQKCSVHHRKFSESRVEHEYTNYVIPTCIIKKLFHFAPINHKSHKSHKSQKSQKSQKSHCDVI